MLIRDLGWLRVGVALAATIALAATATIFGAVPARAAGDADPAKFSFTFANGEATVTGYLGWNPDITIPDVVSRDGATFPVTKIGGGAFRPRPDGFGNTWVIQNVVIPHSVRSIGHNAFEFGGLTSLVIPDSVATIESGAFTGNKLSNLVIPDSTMAVGEAAFASNGLKSVTIPSTWTKIPPRVFQYNLLETVTIPEGITEIGDYAFWVNPTRRVTLPDSLTTIGDNAFTGESGFDFTIPSSVTSIGREAFLLARSVYFEGDAPSIVANEPEWNGPSPTWPGSFGNNDDTTLFFRPGASGFADPTWQGYRTTEQEGRTILSLFPPGTTRIAGYDRFQTSIETAKLYEPGVPVAFISLGTNFPDALSASAAAAILGGPLLTTSGDTIPDRILQELQRLDPAKIYVTGDAKSISDSIVHALEGIAPTTRLGGVDRYDTGRRIVSAAFSESEHAIIATGRTFPDALAATGAAGSRKAPVILVDGLQSAVPEQTLTSLTRLGVRTISIVGDEKSVSGAIQTQLESLGFSVTRYGGAGRYDTAVLVNDAYFYSQTDVSFLTDGTNYPDALAAAAVAGRLGAPIFTTPQQCMPGVVVDSIGRHLSRSRVVMGETNSVSEASANLVACP